MAQFKEKLARLSKAIGEDRIETDWAFIDQYAVDNLRPRAVIFPRNGREVSEVVKMANRENLSIVPRGSGSKIGMGNASLRLDLVVSSSRMNHMLDVDTANLTITVEAGVKFRDIQARLATEEDRCYLPLADLTTSQDEFICSDRSNSGCFLPMDPPFSETATIGGIVAANSSGPRRLLYRLPRDLILGVRFVAPNGDIVGTGGKTVKNVSGYDISKLMTGSAGSLGMLCEMTFKLLPLPEKMETLLFSFGSFSDGCALAEAILETPLLPAAVEIMNPAAYKGLGLKDGPDFDPGAYVVAVALEAFEQAVNRMREEMMDMARVRESRGNACLKEDDHRRFWLTVSHLQSSVAKISAGLITLQLSYPISLMKEVVSFAEKTLSQKDIEHTILVHAGSGGCLIHLIEDLNRDGARGKTVQATQTLLARCLETGGNLMVKHAPAGLKPELKMWGEPGSDLLVMKRLKKQLDPSGIFSPGRFVGGL
ncbi:MAG: FAD-binding oxidoreductase [Desulfobacterales bacterium]|nr:FAD-binding oxidoreductase [Desulfobacterales bacterium]MBL7101780.1 FAD-binding oxidoreductase [Desulfobacteraceae bacterium]MBL7172711.1 FAD-binding oxidoreductase [Desulfobacteraceae bacterium]